MEPSRPNRTPSPARVLLPLLGGVLLAVGVALAARKPRWTSSPLRYPANYQELVYLRSGARVLLRPVHPWDSFRLLREWDRLSEQSRYSRFHRSKTELTSDELHYFTRIDGLHHFALVAVDARGEGLGIARFVRYPSTPQIADVAITVADRVQRQGLGRILLQRLIAAAHEREISTLRAEILSTNRAALPLFTGIAPDTRLQWDGATAIVDIPTAPLLPK
jgi:GNAT superfamily N-acetyltransferase